MSTPMLIFILIVVSILAIIGVRAVTDARKERIATDRIKNRLAREGSIARSIEERAERSRSGDWREPRTKTSTKKPRPRKTSVRSHTRSRTPNNGSRVHRDDRDDSLLGVVLVGAAVAATYDPPSGGGNDSGGSGGE